MAEVSFGVLEGIDPLRYAAEADGLPVRVGPPLPNGVFGAYHDLLRRITSGQLKAVILNDLGFVVPMTVDEIDAYMNERCPDEENPFEDRRIWEPQSFASTLDASKHWALVGRASVPTHLQPRAYMSEPDAMDFRHRIRAELDAVVTRLSEEFAVAPEAVADIAYLHLQKHKVWGRNPTKTQKNAAFAAWGGRCQHCGLPVERGDVIFHHVRRRIQRQHEPANLKIYHTACHDQHHGVSRSLSTGTKRNASPTRNANQ